MATTLATLEQLIRDVPPETPENFVVREQLLTKAHQLIIACERPDNSITRICFGIWEGLSIKMAIDIGLLRLLRDRSPQTTDELAAAAKTDSVFVGRVLRCLTSFGILEQTDREHYAITQHGLRFTHPTHEASIQASMGFALPGFAATPDWLKERGFSNPKSGTETAFVKAYNYPQDTTIWHMLSDTPYLEAMGRLMQSYHSGFKSWMEFYPIQERLLDGAKKGADEVTMCDVAGGLGQQSLAMLGRFAPLPGRLVLEDLEHALSAEKDPRIEYIAHNFLDPQPIKGARFYYLRWIIHDWPSSVCTALLKNIAAVMIPGYSKVIINEWIVPETAPTMSMTTADFTMMSTGGGMERTEAMHREYIEPTGLKISGIWHPNDGVSESIIELELA